MPPLTPAERGSLGGKHRWRNPAYRKIIRIDALTPEERAVVIALVRVAEERKKEAK
jgi:hypothetical protein